MSPVTTHRQRWLADRVPPGAVADDAVNGVAECVGVQMNEEDLRHLLRILPRTMPCRRRVQYGLMQLWQMRRTERSLRKRSLHFHRTHDSYGRVVGQQGVPN